jgi:hypothetical protein
MGVVTSRLCLVAAVVVIVSSPTFGQKSAPVLERVARSLPESGETWKLVDKDSRTHNDGSAQASFRWNNGATQVSATVIIHSRLAAAKKAFEPIDQNDPHEDFVIPGIGDKAYLWPPKVEKDGAWNLRFRKGKVEVWMSGASEEVLKRCARYVAASIAPASGSGLKY